MKTHKPSFAFLNEKIRNAQRILIAGHTGPDFDDVGSCMALYCALRDMHKDVRIASDFHEAIWKEFEHDTPRPWSRTDSFAPDMVLLVDYGNAAKIDRRVMTIIEKMHPFVATIDHHGYQSQFGDAVWIDTAYVSTTQMLYEFFVRTHVRLTEAINYYLLLGVWGDTGAFAHQSISKKLLRMMNALVTRGDEIGRIMAVLHQKMESSEFALYGTMLARTSYDERTHIAVCRMQTNVPEGMSNTVLYEMKRIRGARVLVFLKRYAKTHEWKVSIWGTRDNTLDLNEFARQFGGGGHFNAAGFKTKLSSVKIIQSITRALRGNG